MVNVDFMLGQRRNTPMFALIAPLPQGSIEQAKLQLCSSV